MKKMLLGIVILLTLANLAGVAYASVCQSAGGARMCGTICVTGSGGNCQCEGGCSADELKWVSGAKGGAAMEEEELAY